MDDLLMLLLPLLVLIYLCFCLLLPPPPMVLRLLRTGIFFVSSGFLLCEAGRLSQAVKGTVDTALFSTSTGKGDSKADLIKVRQARRSYLFRPRRDLFCLPRTTRARNARAIGALRRVPATERCPYFVGPRHRESGVDVVALTEHRPGPNKTNFGTQGL